jgi:1-aminocyclopropane-1-carboxylate deaminase/D-cysteine desulfhydrase-like pyridoxal-dependent ACC family enzyme
VAGCALYELPTRVIGISADDAAADIRRTVAATIMGVEQLLELDAGDLSGDDLLVDDRFVGDGYGVPTLQSVEAIDLAARTEALFLDPTYTAKAFAALIEMVRGRTLRRSEDVDDMATVLFWHTGGQVALFA